MKFRCCCLIAFAILASSIENSYGQDEDGPNVRQLGQRYVYQSENLRVKDAAKPLQLDKLFQPFFTAYYVLENMNVIIFEAEQSLLEVIEQEPKTRYRTHGGVI